MSDQFWSDEPETNPYAAPASELGPGSPKNPLLFPAICLLILSSLTVALILVSLPQQIVRIRAIDVTTPHGTGELIGSIGALLVWPLWNVAIALGAISMIQLKRYHSAYTAAIFCLIPICSPCLVMGFPFGIWALVLLHRPAVKQCFMTQRDRTI